MGESGAGRANFKAMVEGTKEEWRLIQREIDAFAATLPDRILDHLKLLDGDFGAYRIDRLQHSLQTATRAHKDGRDEEYVVCALLHDMGDTLAIHNHADIAAAVLKPFVSASHHWMVEQHAVFQGYYFFHHLGRDRDMREQFRGHPDFEATAFFCHHYDQNSFDPNYDTMPLAAFEPMLRRVMARPRRSLYVGPAETVPA